MGNLVPGCFFMKHGVHARISAGSEFHTVGAAMQKLHAPKLSLCDGTHNKLD